MAEKEKDKQGKDDPTIWKPIPADREVTEDLELGECRFNPPVIDFESNRSCWPLTASDMGCYQCRAKNPGWGKLCRNCKAWRKLSEEELVEFAAAMEEEALEDEVDDEVEAADIAVEESKRLAAEEAIRKQKIIQMPPKEEPQQAPPTGPEANGAPTK